MSNQMMTVDAEKLGRALKMAFEGVAMIFDSLGVQMDVMPTGRGEEAVVAGSQEKEPDAAPAAEPKAAEKGSSISADDITKLIVQKIKQNRSNNEKIGGILKKFGVARVSDLASTDYEAFMTELSAI